MKNIKMIVMDMDGTLLNSDQHISTKTLESLLEVQKKGIKIVLASGRSYRTLIPFGKELKMEEYGGYFIGVNGAALTEVKTMKHEVIRQLSIEEIREIFLAVKPFEIEAMAVLDDTIYDYIPNSLRKLKQKFRIKNNIADDVPWTAGTFSMIVDQRKGYNHIYEIADGNEVPCAVNKICLAHTAESLEKPYKWLVENLGDKYHFAKTSAQWIECAPRGINKGSAIKRLAEELHIKVDEILVFGDGENDLSMFEAVTYPIAMGNAMESVKLASYEVTSDNNSDGIAEIMIKYKLI